MTNWAKSAIYGGIYPAPFGEREGNRKSANWRKKFHFSPVSAASVHTGWTAENQDQLEDLWEVIGRSWEKTSASLVSIKNRLKSHLSRKQEVYWPVLIAITLLLFVFASKIAFAETNGAPNNLPIQDNSKLNLIGFGKTDNAKMSLASAQVGQNPAPKDKNNDDDKDNATEELRSDIAKIVKNTPMSAMIDPISEKDRTVAAFIVGIAMKESKFGVYSPHLGGRDCYNYWGFKGGGKTVSGGYTCFSSPEDAVSAVSKRIEKMVAKGVHTPAQAIGWKCGSSCAGHDPAGVRKWISDVALNFYKINS